MHELLGTLPAPSCLVPVQLQLTFDVLPESSIRNALLSALLPRDSIPCVVLGSRILLHLQTANTYTMRQTLYVLADGSSSVDATRWPHRCARLSSGEGRSR